MSRKTSYLCHENLKGTFKSPKLFFIGVIISINNLKSQFLPTIRVQPKQKMNHSHRVELIHLWY